MRFFFYPSRYSGVTARPTKPPCRNQKNLTVTGWFRCDGGDEAAIRSAMRAALHQPNKASLTSSAHEYCDGDDTHPRASAPVKQNDQIHVSQTAPSSSNRHFHVR